MNTLVVILFLTSFTAHLKVDPRLIILEKSITINGNTSLGGFSCDYEVAGKNDTLFIKKLPSSPYSFSVPVEAFKCGNFLLNKDFRTTLKAKAHPEISVQVLKLEENRNGTLSGTIKLLLVGKSKTLKDVNFSLKTYDNTQILSADFDFSAAEFELDPPKKLGGLIKTDDDMNINVTLVLKPAI